MINLTIYKFMSALRIICILLIFFFILVLPTSNVIAATFTFIDSFDVSTAARGNTYGANSPRGVTFSADGTKMFLMTRAGDQPKFFEYSLGTAFDVSTIDVDNIVTIHNQNKDTHPHAIRFSNDGTKLFMTGNSGDDVTQYTLSSAWDITTRSYNGEASVNGDGESHPTGLDFNSDGTKMFVTGVDSDQVHEYSLSTAFDTDADNDITLVRSHDISSQIDDARGLVFNSDGTKMFIGDADSDKVYEYDLGTAYSLSSVSLATSYDVSSQDGNIRGLAISNDDCKLFVTGDDGNDINEYTLSCSSDPSLSSSSPSDDGSCIATDADIVLTFSEAVDVESGNITIKKTSDDSTVETIDVTGGQVSGTGTSTITINPTDFTSGVEYYVLIDSTAFDDSSDNSYAGISSTTALSFSTACDVWDATTKAINNAQSFTAREIIRTSIDMVTERMEFTRNLPHNISKQGIKLDLDVNNENAKKVLNSLQPHLLNQSGRLFNQWSIWTRGNISTGKVGETNDALGQNIHSDGLTVGIDRKTFSNNTVGIAFNRFWRETEIGNNNATVDTDSFNVMYYGSIMPREKDWFDFILGYGELDIDFIRKVGSGNNTANRDGRQIFGSVKYTIQPHDNSPDSTDTFFYSRLDAGYTSLNEYAESGSSQTIHYNKQHIQVYTFALGTTLNREIEIDQGTIMPFLRFEFGANGTNHSLSEAYYTTSPSQISTHAMSDDATAHGRFGLGVEVDLHNNWEIRVAYDRYDSTDDSFTNNIYFTVKKKL